MQPNSNDQPPVPPQQPPVPGPVPQPYQQPVQPQQPWGQSGGFYGAQSPPPAAAFDSPQLPTMPAPVMQHQQLQGPVSLTLPIWMREHWKTITLSVIGAIILLTIAGQFIYPSDRLLPGVKVDGLSVGGMRKAEAAKAIDSAYGNLHLSIYFGQNQAAFQSPQFKDVGISTDSSTRLDALQYPWYLRIIPSSVFWAGGMNKAGSPDYSYDRNKIDSYTQSKVGDGCTIPANDASLKLVGDQLQLVPSVPGGICDITKFQQVLATTIPKPGTDNKVRIDIQETPAMVNDDKANALADALNNRTTNPMPITAGGTNLTIAGASVLSWLDFKSFIPVLPAGQNDPDRVRDGSKLTFTVNRDRMATYMKGPVTPKITIVAGVTKISTSDFTETSHVNGQTGQGLDANKTAVDVENYLNRKVNNAVAETQPVAPKIVYTRTYSPTSNGFAALLAQYPQEHPGTYAMSFQEVTGLQPYRSANYRGDQAMITAGTENGYVGYAVLMGLSNNTILHNDKIVGSRQTDQCFTDMIEKTDMDCSGAFMNMIGHETMVARGNELGLLGTSFAAKQTKTTTNDLAHFLVNLFNSKVAPTANGPRILSTMQTTRLRDGIPAGLTKGSIANLAGEAGTVHNDAAVVYSPKGIYILAIESDGATRANLAEIATKIEALHAIAPPKVKR